MNQRFIAFISAAILFLAGLSTTADPVNTETGKVIESKSPRQDMDFAYYAPVSCLKAKNVPLVISYHGAGGSGAGEIKAWIKLADKNGFIVACPTSILAGHGSKAGAAIPANEQQFTKESDAAISIVEMLKEKFPVDPRRVMVTGFSGGGNPSYWLGLFHPDIFPFLCTRCGNWPSIISRFAGTDDKRKSSLDKTAKESYIYVYWGEKDHPIILGSIQQPLEFLENLKPAHYKKEMISGMGHSSTPDRAAVWFMDSMKEAESVWAQREADEYARDLADGKTALKQGDTAKAIEMLSRAAEYEQVSREGREAGKLLAKINTEAHRLLLKAQVLAKKKDPEAVKALLKITETYRGTRDGNKAAETLEAYLKKYPDLKP